MNHVCNTSGGRTSGYLTHLLRELGIRASYVFMDTGLEDDETYDFIRNIVKHWQIDFTCLRVKINPVLGQANSYELLGLDEIGFDLSVWEALVTKYGCPSVEQGGFCTSRMKTEPHDKYCDDVFGKKNYITWIGIRADEPKRLVGIKATAALKKQGFDYLDIAQIFREIANSIDSNMPLSVDEIINQYDIDSEIAEIILHNVIASRKSNIRYLAEISDLNKQEINYWWKQQPFDLTIEDHLSNCMFCIKKSLPRVALATKDRPEKAIQFIEVVEGPNVRTTGRKHNHKRMYRQKLHLSDVIEMYADQSRDDLHGRLRFSKRLESPCSSEACEANPVELVEYLA